MANFFNDYFSMIGEILATQSTQVVDDTVTDLTKILLLRTATEQDILRHFERWLRPWFEYSGSSLSQYPQRKFSFLVKPFLHLKNLIITNSLFPLSLKLQKSFHLKNPKMSDKNNFQLISLLSALFFMIIIICVVNNN